MSSSKEQKRQRKESANMKIEQQKSPNLDNNEIIIKQTNKKMNKFSRSYGTIIKEITILSWESLKERRKKVELKNF